LGHIRILLADDHTIIRSGLRLLLGQQPDFRVVAEAGDGREAVELVSKQHPDVAVLDIGMPQLNGIEGGLSDLRRRLLSRPAVDWFLADQLDVEGHGHFPDNRRGLLLLAQSLGPLL
jgi:DNA-binding NarL/FixJ family response regulator